MEKFSEKIGRLLAHRGFFIFVIIFFIFEAGWIALSALYPQAFDEQFHFGLIKVYSHYWLPFLSKQPTDANAFGAVARDPSYLYHYLMSFPYRFIRLFIHSQTGQVIALRFINIGLFVWALTLLRRILRLVGTSAALANFCLFLFILIPIIPQMSAQINYDNLLIPLTAWVILLSFHVTEQIRSHKPSIVSLIGLIGLCILTSLVKYAFLPIFLGVIIFLIFIVMSSYKKTTKKFLAGLWQSWHKQSRLLQTALIGLLLVSAGMFIQRDGVNLIEYHNLAPNCSNVLNIKDCSAYSVWSTDYTRHLALQNELKNHAFSYMTPIKYLGEWVYWMWYRSFFAVNGPASNFTNYAPLPLPAITTAVITLIGLSFVIKWRRKIFSGNIYLMFLGLVSLVYILALIIQGYSTYHYTGVLENMNGRYLMPVIILIAAIWGEALSLQLRKLPIAKAVISLVVLVLFLEGGGIITFISRSDNTWYFQNNVVTKVNHAAQKVIKPVVVKGKKQFSSSIWLE